MIKLDGSWARAAGGIAMLGLLLAGGVGFSAEDPPAGGRSPESIRGVWNVTVTLTNCVTGLPLPFPGATFDAMALFEADGTLHDTNSQNPATRSASFGYWERTGPLQYRFAFRFFRFDGGGQLIGSQVVRHDVEMSPDGQSYVSSGTAEFYDTSGNPTMPNGCSRSVATRFR
jgi:hypothetical protein